MTKSYIKDYPRPQHVRPQWDNLNGTWNFWFDDELQLASNVCTEAYNQPFPCIDPYAPLGQELKRTINVPFTYETKLSGINESKFHPVVWYEKEIKIEPEKLIDNDYILHFEGSDYHTKVWVNGIYIGEHRGAYERFSFDITEALLPSRIADTFTPSKITDTLNSSKIDDTLSLSKLADVSPASYATIRVRVEDSNNAAQPRGKQRWISHNFGCWYVQTTGIWKTVWGEYAPKKRIETVKMTPDMTNCRMNFVIDTNLSEKEIFDGRAYIKTTVTYKDILVGEKTSLVTKRHVEEEIDMYIRKEDTFEWGLASWTPEHPDLYDLKFELILDGKTTDCVFSYCAMREIKIEGNDILLNGEPLYQRLILDQGYWKQSGLTPPSEEALIDDIEKTKALGFNGLRKHQKTEDERFLYWCDVKGLLVWSEVAAAYDFNDEAVSIFTNEWMQIVKQNYNHPCIITWTPFNESWGIGNVKTERKPQHFTEAIYNLTKSYDTMRPVIVNDGWEHTVSDILTLHDYEEKGEVFYNRYNDHKDEILSGKKNHCWNKKALADGYEYKGQPVIISEYGGIAFKDNKEEAWGYGNMVENEDQFLKRLESITDAIKALDYVKGFCYTQTSDVEQEINGLLDSSHDYKISPEKIRAIIAK